MLERTQIDTEMLQHLQQLEMRHVADRRIHLLTSQGRGRIGRSHPVVRMRDTVVGIGIGHSHTDNLQIRTRRHEVRKRRKTLRIRNVDITGLHGQGHVATTGKRKPVHLDTQSSVIGLIDLGNLVGRRPLQEIRHVQLIQTSSRLSSNRRRRSRRSSRSRGSRRCGVVGIVAATSCGNQRECQQECQRLSPLSHLVIPLISLHGPLWNPRSHGSAAQ
ncbi:MAG: hypothetical protein MAG471_01031 [Acidimicrobiaceae bacterium]|nr:hypothetical protein [Acidimicrobiaceae bacterium]